MHADSELRVGKSIVSIGKLIATIIAGAVMVKIGVPFWLMLIVGIVVIILFESLEQQWFVRAVNRRDKDVYTDNELVHINNLSGPEFEDLVLDLFHRSGYNANKTRQNYPGIDIIARKIDKVTGEVTEKVVVQCKRFSDLVGKTSVEQFYYRCLKEPPETKKMMFASSGFSRPAWEFAQSHGIQLIDGEAIRKFA